VHSRPARAARLYSADLAYIHDTGFAALANRAAPEIIRILRAHGIGNGLIVEVGCGSSILARHLVEAGYEVFGFDQSAAMIRLARARARAAQFRLGSFTRTAIPPCRAVLAIGEIVTYPRRDSGSACAGRTVSTGCCQATSP
jgi:SAM-dependent methyltransferase